MTAALHRIGLVCLCAVVVASCGPARHAKLRHRSLLSPKDEFIRLRMAANLRRYQQLQAIQASGKQVPKDLMSQYAATQTRVDSWELQMQEILVEKDRTEDLTTSIDTGTVLDRNGNDLALSLDDLAALRLARNAVAILVPCKNLRSAASGAYEMCATTLQAFQPLCKVSYAHYYGDQPIPALCPTKSLCNIVSTASSAVRVGAVSSPDFFCTAFLVASSKDAPPSALLTAAHCLSHYDFRQLRAVFGFTAGAGTGQMVSVPSTAVVSFGSPKMPADQTQPGSDWALLPILEPLTRPALVIQDGAATGTDPVYLVGHPLGLPLKVDWDGALLGTGDSETALSATLDIFQGESGSPVLNVKTHQVVALVADTGADFDPRVKHTDPSGKPCLTLFRCTAADCRAPELTAALNRDLLDALKTLEKEATP